MKCNSVMRATAVSAILTGMTATVCEAQIVGIGFGASAVPLSPWVTALIAAVVAISGAALLRKRMRSGWFVLVLSAAVGSGFALNSERLMAIFVPPTLNLVSSPATTPNLNFNVCGTLSANTLTVNTATPVLINSITVSPTPPWVIDASSTCRVGQTVAASCTVVLNGGAGC